MRLTWKRISPARFRRVQFACITGLALHIMSGSDNTDVCRIVRDVQYWLKGWDEGFEYNFHKEYINPQLQKHVSKLVNDRTNISILIPLCGKTWDMKWLADQGHMVYGVEVAHKAVEEFSTEQDIPFTTQPISGIEGATLYQSENKTLNIFCCDIFHLTKEVVGQFDGIWDRGSLVAINIEDRNRPVVEFAMDETKYAGFPQNVTDKAVHEMYGEDCCVELIEDIDYFQPRHAKLGIDWLREKIFLVTPKDGEQ